MALNRPAMAQVSGTENAPAAFRVVGTPCQLRPSPNLDYFSIGLLRKGGDVKGFPFIISGVAWIRLCDEDAAIHVPDPARREDGVWLPQVHPKYGRLVQSKDEDVRYGAKAANGNSDSKDAANDGPAEGGIGFGKKLVLKPLASYEEMIQAEWTIESIGPPGGGGETTAIRYTEGVFEMVIDMKSGQPPPSGDDPLLTPEKNGNGAVMLRPAKGAIVKRVPVGKDMKATVSNMPDGRYFLVSVVATFDNKYKLRSRWVRHATLNVAGRNQGLSNVDPGGNVRGKCEGKNCACCEYIPLGTWNLNSDPTVHCRRCGCTNDMHAIVGRASDAISRAITHQDAYEKEEESTALPRESKDWDEREKNLWLWSNGALHPRQNPYAARKRTARDAAANRGRVSVVCPTMEERQVFHEQVWACFVNQDWPDKELIVIETYQTRSSDMFRHIAAQDDRLVYLRFRCGQTTELSIGSKRNIAQHIATGDYIANFDDDDVYAPTYLSTMIRSMFEKNAAFVTLSSWYFFDIKSGRFGFFDALEYARVKNMREKDIDGWLWGYGFSYLHKLQPALDRKIDYPDQNMEEDIKYIRAWKQSLGDYCTVLHFDDLGIVCHTLHGRNTSNSFALREVSREEMWDTDVAELPQTLDGYMRMFPRQEERSRFIEYEVDEGKIERRLVERRVHWLNGQFALECNRGLNGRDLKTHCTKQLDLPFDSFRLYRQPPEGGFSDLSGPAREEGGGDDSAEHKQQSPPETEKLPFEHLLGTWVYGSKATEYLISSTGAGEMVFTGPHSRVGTVSGICKFINTWALAELLSPDGERIGQIRLKYVPEADKMISNYRSINKDEWGKDIHALRKEGGYGAAAGAEGGPSSPTSGSPEAEAPKPAPAPASKGNKPIHDDELVGAYVDELWLVITSREALTEVMNRAERKEVYRWTSKGVDAIREVSWMYGYPKPRQPFSEEQFETVRRYHQHSTYESLSYEGFIVLAPNLREPVLSPLVQQPEPAPAPEPEPAEEPPARPPERPPATVARKAPVQASPASPAALVPPLNAAAPESAPASEASEEQLPDAPADVALPVPVVPPEGSSEAAEDAEPEVSPVSEGGGGEVEEVTLVVHIDQALNLREIVTLPKGSTIGDLKELLVTRDVTGISEPSDFKLAWDDSPEVTLPDGCRITGAKTELQILDLDL